MLPITIPGNEYYDYESESFITLKDTTLQLEHSLLSLKKWESKWHIPFLNEKQKTNEQTIDYIRCMTLTQNVDPIVYSALTQKNLEQIDAYIDDPMTATWFGEDRNGKRKKAGPARQVITAELIYYWMVMYHIPFECQKWHLNQLITLIRVCNEENQPKKKTKKNRAMYDRRRALNEQRKAMLHTRG